jgi:hypothetical protein
VFELLSLRNTQKQRDKTIFVDLLEKVFDLDYLQKHFCGVFELSVPSNNGGLRRKNTAERQKKTATNPKAAEIGFVKEAVDNTCRSPGSGMTDADLGSIV